MNIGIIGLGGVGGYYGGKLAKLAENRKDVNVYFIARNKHLAAIKENGLLVKTVDGEMVARPTETTEHISDLPLLDVCFVCVKAYDLPNVLQQLESKIHEKTHIIPLLNGADIHERMRSVIKNGIIHPACVYIISAIESPGVVSQTGANCKIVFGKDPSAKEASVEELLSLLDEANINYKYAEDAMKEVWTKYLYIASYALVTASAHKTMGQVCEDDVLNEQVIGIMGEIRSIALAKGIHLSDDVITKAVSLGNSVAYETTTSFQRDYEQGDKGNEKEVLGKVIIDQGKKYGVQTPVAEKVYGMLV